MEDIMEKLKNVNINNYDIGSEHWIDVTHIEHPSHFYVRPTLYREYLPVLCSYGECFPLNELCVGSNIVYKSKLLKCYARGKVAFIQTEEEVPTCDIFSPDYGCYELDVSLGRIHKPLHSTIVPPLAMLCQLANCKPIEVPWSAKAIETMKYFVGNEQTKIIIQGKSSDTLVVDLINSCPDDISTMLVYSGHAKFGFCQNMVNRLTEAESARLFYTYKKLKIDETLVVRVQAGDSLNGFYVADVNDFKCYLNKKDNFSYYCKKQDDIDPDEVNEGMPVAVQIFSTRKFERAYVTMITVPKEKAIVKLVDWGRMIEVPFCRLRAIPDKYFIQPAIAIYCSADESQTWDNGLNKFLYPGYEFKITVKQLGNKFETPHVVDLSPKGKC